MRPFVLAPQTKKLPASTQKAGERMAWRRPAMGRNDGSPCTSTDPSTSIRPYGSRAISDGRSRMSANTKMKTTTAEPATTSETLRQPKCSSNRGRRGRKRSCPVAFGCSQPAQNKPPVFIEPSICNYGCKDKRGNSSTRSNAHTPEEDKLPQGFHNRCQANGSRQEQERAKYKAPQSPAVHQRGRERSDEPEESQVDSNGS